MWEVNEYVFCVWVIGKYMGVPPVRVVFLLLHQGKRSATCFWPGTDSSINGTHPDYWYKYSQAEYTTYEARVDQVGCAMTH